MKRLARIIVVDADALIALFNRDDVHAARSLDLLDRLMVEGARLVHPATTIVEAVTTLQRRFSHPQAAAELARVVREAHLIVEPVDDRVLAEALRRFNPHGSKQNTLFDAVVATVAAHLNADAIFSFDAWYEKLGFRLVAHLYTEQVA
jgi:predicted nucleic acid-binding protein